MVGELAFKVVNGEYTFFGLKDELELDALFGTSGLQTSEDRSAAEREALKSTIATHALVFQVAELGETSKPRWRRIVGIHAVNNLTAEKLHVLFHDTVANLWEDCGLQVVNAVCDGAGANRLMQKMQTSALLRGSPNTFYKAWCYSDVGPTINGQRPKIFFISDPSHMIKKFCTHLEKSKTDHDRTRFLQAPIHLVEALDRLFPPPDGCSAARRKDDGGAVSGIVFYIRLVRRLYDLMASQHNTLYQSADPAQEPRIAELLVILKLFRAWYETTERTGELNKAAPAGVAFDYSHKLHFLSHQLYFDLQMMIEGFVGLLQYREACWGVGCAAIRVRSACTQDSLESLFGRLRYACGSGQGVSMMMAAANLPKQDTLTQMRFRKANERERAGFNSGRIASAATAGTPTRSGLNDKYAISLPADFDSRHAAVMASRQMPPTYPILWQTLRALVEKDETASREQQRPRRMRWLTVSKHMNKTGFSRMKVGLAMDTLSFGTADMLELDSYGKF